MLYAWWHIYYRDPQSGIAAKQQIIWFNSNIKVQGKLIFWENWFDKDILTVQDILNEDGTIKSAAVLGVNWLQLKTLWKSIPIIWKLWFQEGEEGGKIEETMYVRISNMSLSPV